MNSAVSRYRVAFHADHAFFAGQAERVLSILIPLQGPVPSVNVDRWELWPDRLASRLHAEHSHLLAARLWLAEGYWSAGRVGEAITLEEQVLADRERILGVDHPDTLTTRNNLAAMRRSGGGFRARIAAIWQR
jgi:hypothetical protein